MQRISPRNAERTGPGPPTRFESVVERPRAPRRRTTVEKLECSYRDLTATPGDNALKSFPQSCRGPEPQQLRILLRASNAMCHEALSLRMVLDWQLRSGYLLQYRDKLVDGGTGSASDVEEFVGAVRLHRQNIRRRD